MKLYRVYYLNGHISYKNMSNHKIRYYIKKIDYLVPILKNKIINKYFGFKKVIPLYVDEKGYYIKTNEKKIYIKLVKKQKIKSGNIKQRQSINIRIGQNKEEEKKPNIIIPNPVQQQQPLQIPQLIELFKSITNIPKIIKEEPIKENIPVPVSGIEEKGEEKEEEKTAPEEIPKKTKRRETIEQQQQGLKTDPNLVNYEDLERDDFVLYTHNTETVIRRIDEKKLGPDNKYIYRVSSYDPKLNRFISRGELKEIKKYTLTSNPSLK